MMARKNPKTTHRTGEPTEVAGGATARNGGLGGLTGATPAEPAAAPGADLTPADLREMTAGATRIRIKVDYADLSSPDAVE